MAGSQNIGEASDNPVAINVTAMVDVIFCLCIFFMCSFHFKQLEGRIESWLPKDKGIFNDPSFDNNLVKDEIRVIMTWDRGANVTYRKVMHYDMVPQGPAGDAKLVQDVLQVADGFRRVGNDKFPLVIDAQGDVPWDEVIHVMDLCRRNNISRIEFSAPEVRIEDLPPVPGK